MTLVPSGSPDHGEEDMACAELIAGLLQSTSPSHEAVIAAVKASRAAARHRPDDPDLPLEDVNCAIAIDEFGFAMKAERQDGRVIAKAFF